MLYITVNCSPVFEGTLRNIARENITVKSIEATEIEEVLFTRNMVFAEESAIAEADTARAIGKDDLEKVKEEITGLLDGKKEVRSIRIVKKTKIALYVPDLIIYQPDEEFKDSVSQIKMLRKSCAFRDVPILVAVGLSKLEKASGLVRYGATGILVLPVSPEKLRRALSSVMAPVGTRIPIVTKLINPFISATLDLMATMADLTTVKKEVFLKKNYRLFGDVSGIMNFSGNIEGSVVVSFDEDLARKVIGNIMGAPPESLSQVEIREGVGEIVNIISGNAKAALANTEFGHQITLPTVVTGYGHEINHPPNAPCIVIIFEAAQKPFAVQVSVSYKT